VNCTDYQVNLYCGEAGVEARHTQLRASLASGAVRVAAVEGERGRHIGAWRELDWDTEILGVRTASVDAICCSGDMDADAVCTLLARLEKQWHAHGVELVYFRVDARCQAVLDQLDPAHWSPVDELNIYYCDNAWIAPEQTRQRDDVRLFQPSESEILAFIREEPNLFEHSRIYKDPRIQRGSADIFYQRLAESAIGKPGTVRLGVKDGDRLIGFGVGCPDPDSVQFFGKSAAYVWQIAVARRARGRAG